MAVELLTPVHSDAVARLEPVLRAQREAFLAQQPVPIELRRDRLRRALAMILAHKAALHAAVMQDFSARGADWTWIAEFFAATQPFVAAEKQLHRWMRPERRRAPMPFNLFGARAEIQYQPLGTIGIMGAWNAPLNLVLVPLAPALAAGNRAMLCPSDLMPTLGQALHEAVAEYFDPTEISVAHGGLDVCQAFSQLPFDHLLFTGSSRVGALVMQAAARNLVPVTLELGGKCPVVIGPDADLRDAARRIIGGKTLNGGQACLAPDLLMVPRSRLDAFVAELDAGFRELYPGGVQHPDYCGLLATRYQQRLLDLIAEARAAGARVERLGDGPPEDTARRRIAPHLIVDAPAACRASSEELFGPVFSVLGYDDAEAMCAQLRAMPKPLGLYLFARDAGFRRFVLDRTFSGGVTVGDVLFHYSVPDLPFGGVGRSGIGAYSYGIEGFKRFSHARSVYRQGGPRALLSVMHPPYGRLYDWAVRRQLEKMTRRYVAEEKAHDPKDGL